MQSGGERRLLLHRNKMFSKMRRRGCKEASDKKEQQDVHLCKVYTHLHLEKGSFTCIQIYFQSRRPTVLVPYIPE